MGLGIFTLFTPGTKAYATEVNNNFATITTWADHNITSENLGSLTDTLNFNILNNVSAISIANSGTVSSIAITQSDLLDPTESVIKIVDSIVQTAADAAEFKIEARASTSIPALWVTYGSTDALKLLKTHLKIPKATTAEISAISPAEEGSVVYNSTTQELNVRNSSSWAPAAAGSPVGTVVMYAGATAPSGWLICNGDTIPNGTNTVQGITANFSALYVVLGSTYGSAGKLPDMRGIFPTGVGATAVPAFSGKGYNGGVLGNYSVDSLGSHTHPIKVHVTSSNPNSITGQSTSYFQYYDGSSPFNSSNVSTYNSNFFRIIGAASCNNGQNGTTHNSASAFTTETSGAGTTVKPGSLSLHFIIKY